MTYSVGPTLRLNVFGLCNLPKYAPAGLTISISAPSATSLSVHLKAFHGFQIERPKKGDSIISLKSILKILMVEEVDNFFDRQIGEQIRQHHEMVHKN